MKYFAILFAKMLALMLTWMLCAILLANIPGTVTCDEWFEFLVAASFAMHLARSRPYRDME